MDGILFLRFSLILQGSHATVPKHGMTLSG